jgi:hypothetical protein
MHFLNRYWELIADFFTVEVWTGRGFQRFDVLFFIELSTRKVEIAGVRIRSTANGCGDDGAELLLSSGCGFAICAGDHPYATSLSCALCSRILSSDLPPFRFGSFIY